MKASIVFIVSCALASGSITERTVDIGEETKLTVLPWPHEIYTCHLETPTKTINFNEDEWDESKYTVITDRLRGCTVILTISEGDSGDWRVFFKTDNNTTGETVYRIKVNEPKSEYIPELGTTDNREIEQLPEVNIHDTHRGMVHNITIGKYAFVETESCHIICNDGKEYQMPDVPDHARVEWIQTSNIACGISVTVEEEIIGNWTLYSRDIRYSSHIERRVPVTIYAEETVAAFLDQIIIVEGRDLYLNLLNSIGDLKDTCELHPPEGVGEVLYEIDGLVGQDTCAYIVKNISHAYTGIWYIKYGRGIRYLAPITVIVNEPHPETVYSRVEWPRDTTVDMNIGPDDAKYCKVVDPTGSVLFEKFYRCHIYMIRPEEHHQGEWVLTVGQPGKVWTKEYRVMVTLTDPAPRPEIITSVVQEESAILLSCALPLNDLSIRNCKFQNPFGRVLLAVPGVGEDRYSFNNNAMLETNDSTRNCGIRITNATYEDFGIWRCAIEKVNYQSYYGFLNVGILSNSTLLANTVPQLTPTKTTVSGSEGTSIMSCQIPSRIRYCYFRAENGTVFNINPGVISDTLEYTGLGFEAGDCSVKFKRLLETDSGQWSCHVGLSTLELPEKSASFEVLINKPYTITRLEDRDGRLKLMFNMMHGLNSLEYCRFVRGDGLGFNLDNIPSAYQGIGNLDQGNCGLVAVRPDPMDWLPWTIVARVTGHRNEVWGTTQELRMRPKQSGFWGSGWDVILIILLLSTLVGSLTILMTRDDYKYWKAVKNSRNSFRMKKKLQNETYTISNSGGSSRV